MPNALADIQAQMGARIQKSGRTGSGMANQAGVTQAIRDAYTQYVNDRIDRNIEPVDFDTWARTVREQYGMNPAAQGNALVSLGRRG